MGEDEAEENLNEKNDISMTNIEEEEEEAEKEDDGISRKENLQNNDIEDTIIERMMNSDDMAYNHEKKSGDSENSPLKNKNIFDLHTLLIQ